jgi:hypothetical protein
MSKISSSTKTQATPQAPKPHAQWIRAEPLIIGLGKSGARGIGGFFGEKNAPKRRSLFRGNRWEPHATFGKVY